MIGLEDLCKRWGIQPDNRMQYSNVRPRLRKAAQRGDIVDTRPANKGKWCWTEDDPDLPTVRQLAEQSGIVVGFTELEEIPAPAPAAAPASSSGKRKADDEASPTAPVKHKAAKSKQASPKVTYDPRQTRRSELKSTIRALFAVLSPEEYGSGVNARNIREQLERDAKIEAGSLKPRKKEIGDLIDELIDEGALDRFFAENPDWEFTQHE